LFLKIAKEDDLKSVAINHLQGKIIEYKDHKKLSYFKKNKTIPPFSLGLVLWGVFSWVGHFNLFGSTTIFLITHSIRCKIIFLNR